MTGRPTGIYIPEAGDIVWLDFDPQSGREQAGRRPAVVLSPKAYNDRVGLMICCPLTRQAKGYPFEVAVADGGNVALADQVKSLDWRGRQAAPKGRATAAELADIKAKIASLLSLD